MSLVGNQVNSGGNPSISLSFSETSLRKWHLHLILQQNYSTFL